ncbi:MAG TPA: hypothetical protein VGP05_07240 [Pseudonocardia sp.]|nr:hypothetical protein [Pseudonocardia sp.]
MNSDGSRRVDPLVGLAAGRIVLGAWALVSPGSDTLTAVGHLVRRDVPTRAAAALGVFTGGYLLVGATRLIRELAAAEPAAGAESVGPAPV